MYNLSQKEANFINAAVQEASKSVVLMRHGCVAVINGKIVARGYNNHRTYSHDQFINNTCSCHAETATMRELFRSCSSNTNTYGKYTDSLKGT